MKQALYIHKYKAGALLTFISLFFSFYLPAQGTWTQKANLPAQGRWQACSFSIGTKGYIGMGGAQQLVDFWEWDQTTNIWTQKANFPGGARAFPVHFAVGTKGYFGCGIGNPNNNYLSDFWEYDVASNTWSQKANFGGGGRLAPSGFGIGTKGYVGTGAGPNSTVFNDFWEFDPALNTWTQKANFPGNPRSDIDDAAFTIGNFGYFGTGDAFLSDFYEYDPSLNSWTQRANFGGLARAGAIGFSVGCNGYIGLGTSGFGPQYGDFWEWDQPTDAWVQIANSPGYVGSDAASFSIGLKGYLAVGIGNNSLWEYAPQNICTTLVVLPAFTNISCNGSNDGTASAIPVLGTSPYTYSWLPGNQTTQTITGLSPGTYTVYVTDASGATVVIPITIGPYLAASIAIAKVRADCGTPNGSATANASGNNAPYSYSWSNGQTTATATGLYAGIYTVYVTDINGCTLSQTATILNTHPPVIALIVAPDTSICVGDSVYMNGTNNGVYSGYCTYSWSTGDTVNFTVYVQPTITTTYTLVLSVGNCHDTDEVTIHVFPANASTISGDTSICIGESTVLTAAGGAQFEWSTGENTQGITVSPTITTSYSVITTTNSCKDTVQCTVNVYPVPFVNAGLDTTSTPGNTVTLTATSATNYSWSTGETTASIQVAPVVTTTYCVFTSNTYGCTATDCVTIFIEGDCDIFIPDIFSPNGDGNNDLLFVRSACIKQMKLLILDRLGEKVFETTDISIGWDGTYQGEPLNPAVFVYYLEVSFLSGNIVTKKGDVTLLR